MSKADCRKFAPNVFNKNKCASCFKAKEEHSDEALENNRASRKVAKCGYLFAAPDWDFSNPINRTKRWQRRWFVLYDDGELTYSVDEHPETVPQAIIDMNRVVEVSYEAEEVTGHPFSLALTAADRVHFLKGTSREESKWWFDILSMFPRTNMKTGRHKRNATFPGSKATTIISTQQQQQHHHQQSTAPNSPCLSKGVSIQPFQTPPMARPRFHSHTESLMRSGAQHTTSSTTTTTAVGCLIGGMQNFNSLPVKDTNGRNGNSSNGCCNNNKISIEEDDIIPVKEVASLSVASTVVATSSSSCPPLPSTNKQIVPAEKEIHIVDKDFDDKIKTRRVIRREIRGARSARCNSEILSSLIIQPGNNMNNGHSNNSSSSSTTTTTGKGYALVLPSSTLTAPIGSKNNAGLSSCTSSDRPRSTLLPPVPPPPSSSTTTAAASSSSPVPPRSPVINASNNPHSPFYLYMADVPRNRHYESLESLQHAFTNMNSPSRARHSSSKDMPDCGVSHKTSESLTPVIATKDRPMSMHELGSTSADRLRSAGLSSYENSSRPTTTTERQTTTRRTETINPPGEAVRGDPDGCGLDPVTSFCSPLPDRRSALTLTAPLLDDSLKKGWLLRLSYGGEWKKYWFVLRYNLLSLYRDHAAEDAGLADETIDLAQMASVDETDSGRSYGFQMAAVDGKRLYSLAALTSGIRTQWIQALRNACNQGKMAHLPTKLLSANSSAAALKAVKENVDPAAVSRREADDESLESYDGSTTEDDDDEEEDGDELDDDDDGEVIVHQSEDDEDDQEDRAEPIPSLPPSPPLNRTPMSKVKERDRSRSSSRSRSRHRSASPSSVRTNSPPTTTGLVISVPPSHGNSGVEPAGGGVGHVQIRLDAAKGEITRLLNERREQEREAQQQLVTLNSRLAEKEQQMNRLAGILEATKNESKRQLIDIQNLLEEKEAELRSLRDESANGRAENAELRDSLKRERSEVYKLRDVAQELRSLLDSRNDTLNQLQSKTNEVEVLNRRLKATQENLNQTQERLQRGIEENEGLFARLRQMEDNRSGNGGVGVGGTGGTSGSSSLRRSRSSTGGSMPLPLQLCTRNLLGGSSKKSLPRLDSLSDLSNIDYDLDLEALDRESLVDEYVELRARFERSLVEIRALKRELRQAQSAVDGFEVAQMALKQQWQAKEVDYNSQLNLMAARVQDLTSKMAAADKQVRQLKIKVAKSESREKRRTQSLKGRESFQLSKEVEDKLVDLEHKMAALGTPADKEGPPLRVRKGFEEPTKSFRMRRKSLEGGAVSGGSDSVKILLRVDQLEQQLAGRQSSSNNSSGGSGKKSSSIERKNSLPGRSPQGKPPRSSPLKVVTSTGLSSAKHSTTHDGPITRSSKIVQDLEQCVVELELMFDSNKMDGQSLIGKIRNIQHDLLNPDGVRVAVSTSDGISQVEKIQDLLRVRLSELKVKRDQVRSLGKLDSAAVSQIAAEKLALELAIAEQLSTVTAAKQPEEREMLRDANWTIHKLSWLKRKLNGERSAPALDQSTSFGTYCAALAERLSAIAAISSTSRSHQGAEGASELAISLLPPRVAQQLAEEERDLSILFSKYKEEKLQELARLLAHETIRMGDSPSADNQLVEEVKVREAWLEAQEVANKELVDSEVRQAMTRMAEVFAEDVADEERLAAALLLWPAQQLQYEQRCQVVEEVLRSEMEEAVLLLSNAYERSLLQMKSQTSILFPPEGDLEAALSEFAEVVAHKALIDGHIAVLQGETPFQPLATSSGSDSSIVQNVSIIQETEAIINSMCSPDFFPASLNCGEVAAILHRNLAEPRNRPEDSSSPSNGREDRNGNGNKSSAINEDMIRQKYQAEIEQLRALTEKGMSAMEGSHKRIIAQMEEKHQQDLNRLQVEKERALAEETQATLAALDAMRKAHEAEVQREIARFKEEFLSQVAARQAPAQREMTPNREQEMEEIRRQILSLSEKYSHKCLESAALEQKVSSLSQQMAVSQRQILDLDSRNQQLRSFLDTGIGVDHQPDASPAELLRAKESQLLMLQEDVAELQFCLRESQSREEDLAAMARNMGQYLRTERTLQSDEVAALRHRLEDLLLLSGHSSGGSGGTSTANSILGRKNSYSDDKNSSSRESPPRESIRFHYVRSKDLTRSPSCPRLSGFLSLAPRLTARSVLPPKDPSQAPSGSSATNH